MNNRAKIFSIISPIVLIATIILFFIIGKGITLITFMGFLSILIDEIIFFGGMILIEIFAEKTSQITLRAGCGTTITLYSVISIIVSMIYMIFSIKAVRSFLAIHLILLVACIVLSIIFFSASRKIEASEQKVIDSVRLNSAITEKVDFLVADSKNKKYMDLLKKVSDELRFSDISTVVSVDSEIEETISRLELNLELAILNENDEKDIEINKLIENLLTLINKRKIQVQSKKTGGF